MYEVNPKEFVLEPAQEKFVSIKFKPTLDSAEFKVSSILLIMVKPDGPFYKIRLFGVRGKFPENPPGQSLGLHMMSLSREEGFMGQAQAMQKGVGSHLKDRTKHTSINKSSNGQSKWENITSQAKQQLKSTDVGNQMKDPAEQGNANNLKNLVLKPAEDDAVSSQLHSSVKRLLLKDRDTLIHAIPERDVPFAFQTSTSPSSNASNPSISRVADDQAAVWTIQPDKITLPSSCVTVNCEPVIKRIQIVNYTKQSIPFKLTWPEKYITVTPEHGYVLPRSSTVICLSANIGLQQKGLPLPWSGLIRILSENEAKHVNVKIIAEGDCALPCKESGVGGVRSEFGHFEDGVIGSVTIPDAASDDETDMTKRHQRLKFQPAVIKDTVERVLDISNLSGNHLKWTVNAFAPVYIKKPGQSCCSRLHYSVFWLPLQNGILHPGGQVKVVICFCPREVGFYSQFWEVLLESSDAKNNISQISRIELFASSITKAERKDYDSVSSKSNCSYCDRQMLSVKNLNCGELTGSPQILDVPSRDNLVSVAPLEITFPVSAVNKKSIVKVVMKNRDSKPCMMEITEPDEPFYSRYKKLKLQSHHYLSVPFDFLPKEKGYYESRLLFKSDRGDSFTVNLNGTCE